MASKKKKAKKVSPKAAGMIAGHPHTSKITFVGKFSPETHRKGGARKRMLNVKSGMTIAKALSAGATPRDIAHASNNGDIRLTK